MWLRIRIGRMLRWFVKVADLEAMRILPGHPRYAAMAADDDRIISRLEQQAANDHKSFAAPAPQR